MVPERPLFEKSITSIRFRSMSCGNVPATRVRLRLSSLRFASLKHCSGIVPEIASVRDSLRSLRGLGSAAPGLPQRRRGTVPESFVSDKSTSSILGKSTNWGRVPERAVESSLSLLRYCSVKQDQGRVPERSLLSPSSRSSSWPYSLDSPCFGLLVSQYDLGTVPEMRPVTFSSSRRPLASLPRSSAGRVPERRFAVRVRSRRLPTFASEPGIVPEM
mmetsp:Transcript_22161/g.70797  ORF Transcript_22161/g.70797 Transcript_22161/m.70797 type:complete len:217 (+) Transcript_22161:859-1509(+)